jgi:hypothetical protein
MRPRRILPVFGCALILLGSGCREPVEPQTAVSVECEISPQPVRVGPAIVNVRLRDSAGAPVVGGGVNLVANMSHPGMAPVFGDAKEVAPGQYRGSVELAMLGDWVVLIHVTLPNGRKLERQVSVPGVTAN